jgi:hypothetical protein
MDGFWDGSYESGPTLTDAMVRAAEREGGYRLPAAYVQLLRTQNGGYPQRKCFPLPTRPGRRPDYVRIERFIRLGEDGNPSYCREMIDEWEYPDAGLVVADTPDAGHTAVMLDYSECGPDGEPRVVHVETEDEEPEVLVLAPDFVAELVACPDEA